MRGPAPSSLRRLSFFASALSLGIVLMLGGMPCAAQAQSASPDSLALRRFRLADSYLQAGRYERAIALLEDLYASNPGAYVFYTKLKEAYESVKRFDDAIALVEDRLAEGRTPMRLSEKARLLYLKGDEQAAFDTWDAAIALAPDRASTYRVVYQALVEARHFQRAIDVLERGRQRLDDPTAFRIDLAYLYSLNGQHEQAMQEYLQLLQDHEQRLGFVRSRLSPFLTQGGGSALDASIDVLQTAVQEHPMNLAYRELLAWLLMEDASYRAALDVYRALDRLQQENGQRLLTFAHQAADADSFRVAQIAYEEILTRYPNASIAPEAQRSLGNLHRRWAEHTGERAFTPRGERQPAPHYEAAVAAYRTYLRQYPTAPAYPSVLQALGQLQQDVFMQLDEAEATLRRVVERYPDAPAAAQARYDLGRLALVRGNFDEARLIFSRLVDAQRGDLDEKARYELALLHFYEGAFDAALTFAEAVNANPATEVANDAIALKVLIAQHKGPDSLNTALRRYARARLLNRQRRYPQALNTLDSLLARHGTHPLTDEARFLRATVLREQGRAEPAMKAFAEIPLMYPQSPLADRSLFQAATLQAEALNDPAGALDTYTRLLEKYPGSLLASKARARIRALRAARS